ncbi:ParB N-terminal domain-containing protein [Novosphingobium sp. TCA1]|uniref:ParB/RepB/Spo0J family partition protein n=1 Tax=Novosphingobium sp. TCA1 TaxID=2682474 RepID=UPI00130A1148|nr:ParB N-terminal domain-containing protein [Novosphingobium sp. TCA1]GFE77031.1 chromosome partitioning protein ParB [Novosphingobium sp. TCA1]
MKLEFIALGNLSVSKSNMRYARKAPDVSDILPTVRARGVLQPILVRPSNQPGEEGQCYEIVAGCRRFHAARIVAAEREEARIGAGELDEPGGPDGPDSGAAMLPCAVLDETDDASAVEASLIENIARLDPDEVSRWACFTRLVKEGRSIAEIGSTFGLPDLAVRRALALGNLLPRIREMYRREEIDAVTIRHLTLASKSRQKAWLALVDDPDAYAPRGHQLKSWLFNGASIPARHALFDLAASGLATVSDLFGEDAYFAESEAFWALQNAAIAERRAALIDAGWSDAVIVSADEHFHSWEYEKTAKRKGGRVYLDVRGNGEVVVHEGYLSRKEEARLAKGGNAGPEGEGDKPVRAELTSLTQTYVDLHRHATVRTELLASPRLALRLMVAHVIAGSPLWRVQPEPQAVKSDAVRQSLDECRAESVFDARRREVLAALGLGGDDATVTGSGYGAPGRNVRSLLARIVQLPDAEVLDVLALVMGETLAAGTPEIEVLGPMLGLSMADWWEADDAFLDGLHDREVLLAMVAEVAGEQIAAANAKEKGKTLKAIIRAHLAGEGGRTKKEGWVPRWMAFPPSAYTLRGGVGTVAAHARAMTAMEDVGKDAGESDGCERASDPTDAALDAEVPVELVGADGSPSDQVTTQQAA